MFKILLFEVHSCDSSVGIENRLRDGRSGFQGSIPGEDMNFSVLRVQNGSLSNGYQGVGGRGAGT
jgi:hypothetical protein